MSIIAKAAIRAAGEPVRKDEVKTIESFIDRFNACLATTEECAISVDRIISHIEGGAVYGFEKDENDIPITLLDKLGYAASYMETATSCLKHRVDKLEKLI